MVDIKIEMRSARARKTLLKLVEKIKDMKPIWKQFINYWQDDLMRKVWDSQGKAMEKKSWASLTPKYAAWKKKNYPGKRILELTGKLFDAVQGGSGWYQKVKKKTLTMGVRLGGYEYWVQHRKTNPRYYFYTQQEDLPDRAYAYLIKITDERLESDK